MEWKMIVKLILIIFICLVIFFDFLIYIALVVYISSQENRNKGSKAVLRFFITVEFLYILALSGGLGRLCHF